MRSYFSVPRRYDFPIPSYEATELPNKCQHLNNIIKKLIILSLRTNLDPVVISGYYVNETTLYALSTDIVSGNKLTLTAGIVEGNKLTLQ